MEIKMRGTNRTGLSVSLNETRTLEASKVWSAFPYLSENEIYMAGIKHILENPDDYKDKISGKVS